MTRLAGREDALRDEPVLLVPYPAPSDDLAGRDVWCDAEVTDWTSGSAIGFRVRPDAAERISVSFFDRQRVAYTTWLDLQGGVWQPVRVAFDRLLPNPYFQLEDAKIGAPIDVSRVEGLAFAPHGQEPGRLAISRFVLTS